MIAKLDKLLKSDKPENLHIVMYEGSQSSYCNQFSGFLFGRNRMGKFRRGKHTLPIFYVYLIIKAKNYEPLYVGKGNGGRVIVSNKRFRIKTICKLVFFNLLERGAFELEMDLIEVIGRRDLGTGPLLNMTDGGEGSCGVVGKKMSEEGKRKLSLINKGKKLSQETICKMVEGRKGYNHSEETKKKIGLANSKKRRSEEQKIALSKIFKGRKPWNTGKKWSEETKRKISVSLKGYKHTEETRKNMSLAQQQLGKTISEEHKQKISLANKQHWKRKRGLLT